MITKFQARSESHVVQAVIYIRVSTSRQLDGASLDTQESSCRQFCEKNCWQVVQLFREEGESAKTADRSKLQEMLRFCRSADTRPEYVVVYSLDRFARNGMDHDKLRAELLAMRIKLRCVQTPLGETPYDKAVERILSTLPQLENELRAERSVAGMKTRLEDGRWTFKAPLGYVNVRNSQNGKTLLHDPKRAPLIQKAFELYATGLYTKEQVREQVTALGLRTKRDKPLGSETFDRMLRNSLYAGLLEVEDWGIAAKGNFEPIIGRDVFDRVQQVLEGRRHSITPHKRNREDLPLRGFVRCGHCHRPVTGSLSTGKMGVKYLYYNCQNRACATRINVRAEKLHQQFVAFLRQRQPDSKFLKLFHKVVNDVWNAKQADATELVRTLEKRIDDLKERKRKLLEAMIYHGTLERADFDEMRLALEAELASSQTALSQALSTEIEIEAVLDFAENLLLNAAGVWEQCSLDQKQRLQRVLFPKGVEYADGIYRTQQTSFLFKTLTEETEGNEVFGSGSSLALTCLRQNPC